MSKIVITDPKEFSRKDLLSYVESLGGSTTSSGTTLIDGVYTTKFEINSKDPLHRFQLVTETCRKLDTLNVTYEVSD